MNEQKNNGRGIFYGVIGVATLVVAIIGATFAYFTATQSAGNNVIGGNMATISFGVQVEKVVDPGQTSGMIPMSNDMVETAINNTTNNVCVDDNGNAVCQIYKITVTNTSSAAMFVDGYVALTGGSGTPTDFTAYGEGTPTTMRWAQVFPGNASSATNNAAEGDYSTAGVQVLGSATETMTLTQIGVSGDGTNGKNTGNIISDTSYRGTQVISGSTYTTVAKNFIRVSKHATVAAAAEGGIPTPNTSFDRTDYTSTLVLSQQLQPVGATDNKNIAIYYIMVWLSETGTSQNPNTTGAIDGVDANLATSANNFFNGVVTFNSAQGSEVTATFSGYAAVQSDKAEAGA